MPAQALAQLSHLMSRDTTAGLSSIVFRMKPENTSEECGSSCASCAVSTCSACKTVQKHAKSAFFSSTPCHSRLRPNSARTALPCSPVTKPSHAPHQIKGSIRINLHRSNDISGHLRTSQDIRGSFELQCQRPAQ